MSLTVVMAGKTEIETERASSMLLPNLSTATAKEKKELIDQARKASEMLKALSHENRLLILCLLAEGEKSVSELEDIMDMQQAAVSQQLSRLRLDGLVNARRDGRNIFYSIASEEVSSVIEQLHRMFCQPHRPAISRKSAN